MKHTLNKDMRMMTLVLSWRAIPGSTYVPRGRRLRFAAPSAQGACPGRAKIAAPPADHKHSQASISARRILNNTIVTYTTL